MGCVTYCPAQAPDDTLGSKDGNDVEKSRADGATGHGYPDRMNERRGLDRGLLRRGSDQDLSRRTVTRRTGFYRVRQPREHGRDLGREVLGRGRGIDLHLVV